MKHKLWRLLAALCCAGSVLAATAQTAVPARVMLIGLWHFDNPGLDAVKVKPIDVMRPAEQKYLQDLTVQLAAFKPTRVLLEYPTSSDAVMNQRYQDFVAGKFELKVNEIYQLGFRIAKAAGLNRVEGMDVRGGPSDDALWKHLMQDPALSAEFKDMIAAMSVNQQKQHDTLSLRELLLLHNEERFDRDNQSFYLWLNTIGTDSAPYLGADAAAHWWQRNFRMYAHIQRAAQPGGRVLVIAGQGHTAVMRDLLKSDLRRQEERPDRYF
jgi:hypothetical protein